MDLSSLVAAVDFSSVAVAVLAIAAMLAAVYAYRRAVRWVLEMIAPVGR